MSKPLKLSIRLPELRIESRSIGEFSRVDEEMPDMDDLAWLFFDVISRLPYPRRISLLAHIAVHLAQDGEEEAMDPATSQGFVDAAGRLIDWWAEHDASLELLTRASLNGQPDTGDPR